MKTSELLRLAKTYLWDGKDPATPLPSCICFAIKEAACDASKSATDDEASDIYELRYVLRRRIAAHLAPYSTLAMWLHETAGVPYSALTDARVQAHRHAWLDMLIAEHEAKGD